MWSFEQPLALAALLLLPPAIYCVHYRRGRGGLLPVTWQAWGGVPLRRAGGMLRPLAMLARWLFWLAVAALIGAAAGPVRLHRERVFLSPGLDLMVVLDESPSMAARDLADESRFATAIEVIRDFVVGRENDAIGVVSFSDRAALRVPKTLDRAALSAALDRLRVMTLGDATAIGMGIAVALLHLQDGSSAGRVIILLTDGENNAGEILPASAAGMAAQSGVRIYTIGIGREGDAVLELTDPRSGLTRRGLYHGRFDEALLQRLAALTGGRYFAATEPGALAAVFREIDSLERIETRTRVRVVREPHHVELLLAALALLLLEVLLRRSLAAELF